MAYRRRGTIEGSAPIEVCALPTVPLYAEGEVLDNPKQVRDYHWDGQYNEKMLENMSKFFQQNVESQSAGAKKVVSPDGDTCTYQLPTHADSCY
jgi:hypothetical protein